jgi:hypothetical protein
MSVETEERMDEGKAVALSDDDLIRVCAACFCASCWQGEFYCNSWRSAGVLDLSVATLRALDREHENYWPATATGGKATAACADCGERNAAHLIACEALDEREDAALAKGRKP